MLELKLVLGGTRTRQTRYSDGLIGGLPSLWPCSAALPRPARSPEPADGGARRSCRPHGRRITNRGEGYKMTKNIDDAESERHRAKMAKRKAVQDAEVAEKIVEKGLLIVHTGAG